MKEFLGNDFLLNNPTAVRLFNEHAKNMPIVDFHCHIDPREIAENRRFENITQVLLGGNGKGDHYVWRLMRAAGFPEEKITGSADDRERFQCLAETLPGCIGNPVYDWLHLELRRYFGYEGVLNGETAEEVWKLCNEKLQNGPLTVNDILKTSGVEVVVTTDDPVDDLHWHRMIREKGECPAKVLPAWRPDKALAIEKPDFADYMQKLSQASGVVIRDFESLKKALSLRLRHFENEGCRITDHGLTLVPFFPADDKTVEKIFKRRLKGETLDYVENDIYRTAVLLFLGREYAKRDWVMQIHYGPNRNVNYRAFEKLGPDAGYDCAAGPNCYEELTDFLNALEVTGELPKTVVYSLNGQDNLVLTTILGCFQAPGIRSKMQHGSAWWFNDTKDGMEAQLKNLANEGVLGNFIGMLTDSRSFMSYVRHEYFRRILCNVVGSFVENGEYPADFDALGKLIENISYRNAKEYFGI